MRFIRLARIAGDRDIMMRIYSKVSIAENPLLAAVLHFYAVVGVTKFGLVFPWFTPPTTAYAEIVVNVFIVGWVSSKELGQIKIATIK